MPKRFIVCCDGTWCDADKGGDGQPSNVAQLSRMLARQGMTEDGLPIEQVIYYQTGIGTGALNEIDRIKQGMFGVGVEENVITAYHFIATNYAEGDEILVFGFSRGAYTARSLAGILTKMGLLRAYNLEHFREMYQHFKKHGDSIHFGEAVVKCGVPGCKAAARDRKHYHVKTEISCGTEETSTDASQDPEFKLEDRPRPKPRKVKITVCGVWDTVGSLGLPSSLLTRITGCNKGYEFHDTALNNSIDHAFQALALDEHRGAFTPTLWYLDPDKESTCDLRQCWFPGYHSDVGGGTPISAARDQRSIDEVSLAWMCDQIDGLVTFDKEAAGQILREYEEAVDWTPGMTPDSCGMIYRFMLTGDDVHRTPGAYHKMLENERADPNTDYHTKERMHPSIQLRIEDKGVEYFPKALSAQRRWFSFKTPRWEFNDFSAVGEGAQWTRPSVESRAGIFKGTWPFQRHIHIKEHIVKERPGMNNFEVMLLAKDLKEKLMQRNRKELESPSRVF